jgi:hypothetical protein
MNKAFVLKDINNKKLGEIFYSSKKIRIDIPSGKEKREIAVLLHKFLKEGVRDLGEVILDKPIKPGDPLFLREVQNQLGQRGYILIEQKKK